MSKLSDMECYAFAMPIVIRIISGGPQAWTFSASDSSEEVPLFRSPEELLDWIELTYVLPPHSADYTRDLLDQDIGIPAPILGAKRREGLG